MTGYVHSLQSLGAVDGPGIRFVVFLQGCPLRCVCCHNPDTWSLEGGHEYTPEEIVRRASSYREYFGDEGGITLSGGEPLIQPEFAEEVFRLCHENGINTCLDTSGCLLSDKVKRLLEVTDRVLLDVKYTDGESYEKNVGMSYQTVIDFLEYLDEKKIPTTLRQVIIPTLNDNEESVKRFAGLSEKYSCVDKTELLPFRKICQMKYDKMGIRFPLEDIPEPKKETMELLKGYINQ